MIYDMIFESSNVMSGYATITWCCGGRPVGCRGISSWLSCLRRHSKLKAVLWEAVWKNSQTSIFVYLLLN